MTKDCTSSVVDGDADGASTMDLSGRCVGSSYILQRPIGQGATGTVWRGLDRSTGEAVAVKLLHESLLRQPKLVTRFVQERTILLMLRHRNVVRVRDLFSVGETLGLVMDLVDGGSLRDHLREFGPMPAGEAARLACQVAAALAEAHELGVIHRDLKPDNILLRREGDRLDTRLTDFGVARILNTPSMTTPNTVVGTPHYMAPEAFYGTTASPATDVYALGVLLYELVAGRPPYDSDDIPELMRRHMEGNPVRPRGIAEPIWDVIDQCMTIKPRLRPSAAELVVSLSDAARDCAGVAVLVPAAPPLRAAASMADGSADERDPVSIVPLPRFPHIPSQDHGSSDRDARDRGSIPGPGAGDRIGLDHGAREANVLDHDDRSRAAMADGPSGAALSGGLGGTGSRDRQDSGGLPGGGRDGGGRDGRDGGGRDGRDSVGRGGDGRAGDGRDGDGRDGADRRRKGSERVKNRGNAAPSWRWARPGATLIAAAMLASAVAATVWHFGRPDGPGTTAEVVPQVLGAPSGRALPHRGTAGARVPRKTVAAPGTGRPVAPVTKGSAVARSVTAAPVPPKSPAQSATNSRSPQPEAKPYGPWQCTQSLAFDMASKTPLWTKPCQMLGTDIQVEASLTAPGGGTGSITVSLQEAGTGRTVAGPKTCGDLAFGGDAATHACGPLSVDPTRGRKYAVLMSYHYERGGRVLGGLAKGSPFTWS